MAGEAANGEEAPSKKTEERLPKTKDKSKIKRSKEAAATSSDSANGSAGSSNNLNKEDTDIVFPKVKVITVDEQEEEEEDSTSGSPGWGLSYQSPLRENMMMPMPMNMPCWPMGMGMGMPMGMPWMAPSGLCGPTSMGYVPDNEQFDNAELEEPEQEASEEEPDEEVGDENLLGRFNDKFTEKIGQPVNSVLARNMNEMWNKGRDAELMRQCFATHLMPSNVTLPKVEANVEIRKSAPPFVGKRDEKLKSLQGGLAQATVPLMRSLDKLMVKGECPVDRKQEACELGFECLSVLGTLNANINDIRRGSFKEFLEPKYKTLGETVPGGACPWLFGDKESVNEGIRVADTTGKLGKKKKSQRGRGQRFNPYHLQQGYGFGGYQQQGYGGRGGQGRGRGRGYGQQQQGQGMYGYLYMLGCMPGYGIPNERSVSRQVKKQSEVVEKVSTDKVRTEHDISDSDSDWSDFEQNDDESLLSCREERPRPACRSEGQGGEVEGQEAKDKVNKDFFFKWNTFEAGRAGKCWREWACITSDRNILRGIKGFKIEFMSTPIQSKAIGQLRYKADEIAFLRKEIGLLIEKGVLMKVEHVEGEYISNVFLREKKDKGKYRFGVYDKPKEKCTGPHPNHRISRGCD
jgi:hypothetical protein